MSLYSVKMRAWKTEKGKQLHISGAERFVPESALDECLLCLKQRALSHEKGRPTGISLKVEHISDKDILRIPALPTTTTETKAPSEGLTYMYQKLSSLYPSHSLNALWKEFLTMTPMRGAMIWGLRQHRRLEPNQERGIRVTYMDHEHVIYSPLHFEKNHYLEELALARKVMHHPLISVEICISDDPFYTTGYISTKEGGYNRITNLKEIGSPLGGRLFVYDGPDEEIEACFSYLEEQKVIVY